VIKIFFRLSEFLKLGKFKKEESLLKNEKITFKITICDLEQ